MHSIYFKKIECHNAKYDNFKKNSHHCRAPLEVAREYVYRFSALEPIAFFFEEHVSSYFPDQITFLSSTVTSKKSTSNVDDTAMKTSMMMNHDTPDSNSVSEQHAHFSPSENAQLPANDDSMGGQPWTTTVMHSDGGWVFEQLAPTSFSTPSTIRPPLDAQYSNNACYPATSTTELNGAGGRVDEWNSLCNQFESFYG
jgi:hypothetical protein